MRSHSGHDHADPAHDARRFREVVLPHLGDALALARWLSRSPADAEDIVQEACLRVLAGLPTYRGGADKAWLLAIVRNTCFTWLARNRPKDLVMVGSMSDVEKAGAAHDPEPDPERALIEAADEAAVRAAVEAVPHPFREVLVLRDVNGLSYKEIAAMLEAPIGTVMSRLARGRALLAAELGRMAR